jgi:hypothetical protein
MTRLEDLTRGALVRGVLGDRAVRVVDVDRSSAERRADDARRARSQGVTEKQRQEERGRRWLNAARRERSAGW